VGPYPTRQAAETAVKRLTDNGMDAQVLAQ
jgi:hypothetical protein